MVAVTEESKRTEVRPRVLKGAKIVSLERWNPVDCVVRDLSTMGARIACKTPDAVAETFRLLVPTDNSIRNARVVWRHGEQLGVVFTSEKARAPVRKV